MKRLIPLAAALVLTGAPFLAVQAATPEAEQIAVLQSDASSPGQKDAACARLKRIGTAASVPALAALLSDAQLSQSALYALESMAAPEAGRALTEAVGRTPGQAKTGIINSLGNRREQQAVGVLVQALGDPDAAAAAAAATALGKIGGNEAIEALRKAWPGSSAALRRALADGLLRAAVLLVRSGDRAAAGEIFSQVYRGEENEGVRVGAYAGIIRSAGPRALTFILTGIQGEDSAARTASLQLARSFPPEGAVAPLAALLSKSPAPIQVALIGVLAQRGDASAAEILPLAQSPDAAVRQAALEALGVLGDASAVPVLTAAAATATGSEQAVARRSLARLREGKVLEALLAQLATGTPAIQAEAAGALGERGESAAVPYLLDLARTGPAGTRRASLKAIATLIDPPQLVALVALVSDGTDDSIRAEAAEALNTAMQRLRTKNGTVDTGPLVRALAGGSPGARVALLPVCSGLAEAQVRASLRTYLADADPQVRAAAIRAVCDTLDAELLPDLLRIACSTAAGNLQTLAINGCVRLATQEETVKLQPSQQIATLQAILAAPLTTDQKRLVLSGLAEIPEVAALRLVENLLQEPAVQPEAARAAIRIAPAVADADYAAGVLRKILAANPDPSARQGAEAALGQIDARASFITAWEAAGPFRQSNQNYAALFDVLFAPEGADAHTVRWQTLPAGADPSRPWAMDLARVFGGEQCAAYARTSLYSAQQQPVRFEIGSDDGIRLWLNGVLVHSNNTARPMQPAQDRADAVLKAGWNELLVKVTQNNGGWEFCLRAAKADGSRLEGIRADPARK